MCNTNLGELGEDAGPVKLKWSSPPSRRCVYMSILRYVLFLVPSTTVLPLWQASLILSENIVLIFFFSTHSALFQVRFISRTQHHSSPTLVGFFNPIREHSANFSSAHTAPNGTHSALLQHTQCNYSSTHSATIIIFLLLTWDIYTSRLNTADEGGPNIPTRVASEKRGQGKPEYGSNQ